MSNKATVDKYETKATVDEYRTKAIVTPYRTKVTNIQNVAKEIESEGEQPISSIATTAQFYNEIRLEEGYSDEANVNPLTNFADSGKPNATQGTPSKQGEYVANDINGHPSILVDGVDDFYDLGDTYEDVFRGDFGFVMPVKVFNDPDTTNEMFIGINDGGNETRFQVYILSDNKLRFDYRISTTTQYTSDVAQFIDNENPWKLVGVFLDFTNDAVYITIDGSDVAITNTGGSAISALDPSLWVSNFNPYLFSRNSGGSDIGPQMNARSPAPATIIQSLSDYRNAFDELNQKYAIY